jgi:hypothetical protein
MSEFELEKKMDALLDELLQTTRALYLLGSRSRTPVRQAIPPAAL